MIVAYKVFCMMTIISTSDIYAMSDILEKTKSQ